MSCYQVDFAVLGDNSQRQIPGPCLRAEKAMEHERDSDTNFSSCPWNSSQEPG